MIVLGFDTSTRASAIGLRLHDGATVQARDDPSQGERPGHATRLLPLAAGLLAQAGLRFADVDRIAVGVGPGTFTGLRIGLASARGLAQSLDAELVGVSSLRALALVAVNSRQAAEMGVGVLALIDARRGEAFAAAYAPVEAPAGDREPTLPRELAPPRALAPARYAEILEEAAASGDDLPGWTAVGNGAVLYRDALHALGIDVPADDAPLHRVSGEAICALGRVGVAQAIDTVLPDYRRRPDAELALEHATGAESGSMSSTRVAESGIESPREIEIRRLLYPDLPQVIAIERRVFPTPWSLAMFVLELSKQSGICLAAIDSATPGGRPLIGYLICSRYETVWHIMNIAVDAEHQGRGVASALLAELYRRVNDDTARYTLEVRRSNRLAIGLYEREGFRAAGLRRRYYQDNGEDALVMWRTPATLQGHLDDVPNPGPV